MKKHPGQALSVSIASADLVDVIVSQAPYDQDAFGVGFSEPPCGKLEAAKSRPRGELSECVSCQRGEVH